MGGISVSRPINKQIWYSEMIQKKKERSKQHSKESAMDAALHFPKPPASQGDILKRQ
jgi:hypothetical protein